MPKCSQKDIQRATRWNQENKNRRKIILDRYYKKYNKRDRERQRFGTYRKDIFERDNYICQECNKIFFEDKLVVHHIDGKGGRYCKEKNNSLENLQTLCRSCHIRIHHKGIKNPKKAPTKETHPNLWKPLKEVTKEKIRATFKKLYENGYVSPNKGKRRAKKIICLDCKKLIMQKAKGFCSTCYARRWYRETRSRTIQNALWV